MSRLYVYLYTNNLDSPEFVMDLTNNAEDIRLIWQIHGGLVSIEMPIGMNSVAAYDFYERYTGYRVVVLDNSLDVPVADAFITEISLTATGVRVVCNGFWWRHYDQLYAFDETAKAANDNDDSNLTYNPVANSFRDTEQDFSDFASVSPPSLYKISVFNDNNTTSWGYIGGVFSDDTAVYVYQDYDLTTAGWNGEDPSGKTPQSYVVVLVYNYYTTSEIVIDALTNEVPAISTDYSSIDDTGTVIGFWSPPLEDGGMYPAEVIEKLASFSDSNNAQWNYWLENLPLDGVLPQKPKAHFAAQLNDGTANYNIYKWMLAGNSDSATRNIQELRNSVRVIYRDMEDGESAIAPETGPLEDAASMTKYWRREIFASAGDAYEEIAETYAGLYLSKYKDALLSRPVTITSPWIYDEKGSRVPLWHPIKHGQSYFRLADLFPTPDMFSESWNRTTAGQAIEMEYSYKQNELRIFLDTESNELDALVARMDGFQ